MAQFRPWKMTPCSLHRRLTAPKSTKAEKIEERSEQVKNNLFQFLNLYSTFFNLLRHWGREWGKSKSGLSNGGLRPLSATRTQSSAIVHILWLFGPFCNKTVLGPASPWNRFWRDFLEVWGGSEANFLEVCFGRIPSGNLHTKAASKKSRPPSGNFCPNPPELPRSPSRSFSSHEAGWKIILCKGSFRRKIVDNRGQVP